MRGSKYPTKDRARAVGIALVDGVPAASQATGIPVRTIYDWKESPEFAELRTRNKDAVTGEWWAGVQLAFRRTIELLGQTEDPVKAATAGAIMFDKTALARGEATMRSETRTWTDNLSDDEKGRLRDWIDSLDGPAGTSESGAATGTPSAAGAEVR